MPRKMCSAGREAKRLATREDELRKFGAFEVIVAPEETSIAVHNWQELTVLDCSTAQPRWHTARTPTQAGQCGRSFRPRGTRIPSYLARFTPDSRMVIMQTAEDLQWRDALSGETQLSWCQTDVRAPDVPAPDASACDRVLAYESGVIHRDIRLARGASPPLATGRVAA